MGMMTKILEIMKILLRTILFSCKQFRQVSRKNVFHYVRFNLRKTLRKIYRISWDKEVQTTSKSNIYIYITLYLYIYIFTYILIFMYILRYTCIHILIYIYIYIYKYINRYILIYIDIIYIHIYIYINIYIHRHVCRPSQDSSVWLGLRSREQLMLPECSKHQVLSFAKRKYIHICIYIRMYIHVCMYIYVIYMWIYIHTKNQTFVFASV